MLIEVNSGIEMSLGGGANSFAIARLVIMVAESRAPTG